MSNDRSHQFASLGSSKSIRRRFVPRWLRSKEKSNDWSDVERPLIQRVIQKARFSTFQNRSDESRWILIKHDFIIRFERGARVNFLKRALFLFQPVIDDCSRGRTITSETIVEITISRIRSPKISHFRKVNLSRLGRIEELISNELTVGIYIYLYRCTCILEKLGGWTLTTLHAVLRWYVDRSVNGIFWSMSKLLVLFVRGRHFDSAAMNNGQPLYLSLTEL